MQNIDKTAQQPVKGTVAHWKYYYMSYLWNTGYHTISFGKPGYYILGDLAISILGYYDYTLRYLSAFADLINIVLIYLIAVRVGMSRWSAFFAASAYAVLPFTFAQSISGLAHAPSSTFVLFGALMLLIHISKEKSASIPLALAGLSLSYAPTVHMSTMILSFGFVLSFVAYYIYAGLRHKTKMSGIISKCAVSLAVLALSGIAVIVFISALTASDVSDMPASLERLYDTWTGHRNVAGHGMQGNIIEKFSIFLQWLPSLLTWPLVLLNIFLLCLHAALLHPNVRRYFGEFRYIMLALVFWAIVLVALTPLFALVEGTPKRLMVPFVPFILLGTSSLLESAFFRVSKSSIIISFLALTSPAL
jgi:hypothetical protein